MARHRTVAMPGWAKDSIRARGDDTEGGEEALGENDAQTIDCRGVVRPHGVMDLVQLLGRLKSAAWFVKGIFTRSVSNAPGRNS